jgi:hypothetical protein
MIPQTWIDPLCFVTLVAGLIVFRYRGGNPGKLSDGPWTLTIIITIIWLALHGILRGGFSYMF